MHYLNHNILTYVLVALCNYHWAVMVYNVIHKIGILKIELFVLGQSLFKILDILCGSQGTKTTLCLCDTNDIIISICLSYESLFSNESLQLQLMCVYCKNQDMATRLGNALQDYLKHRAIYLPQIFDT